MTQVTVLGKLYDVVKTDNDGVDCDHCAFDNCTIDCQRAPACSWQCRDDEQDVYFVEVVTE